MLRHDTFVAVGQDIVVYKRNRVVRTYKEHRSIIAGLFLIGNTLLSYDVENTVKIIDVNERSVLGSLDILQAASISCVMHPATYLNKILIGYSSGLLELWNIRSRHHVYTFSPLADGINAAVVSIEQSPACDVVAIGFSNGDIILLNLKLDSKLFTFQQKGAVTSLSFRTDTSAYTGISPYLITGSAFGELHIWRLGSDGSDSHSGSASRRGLVCSVKDAHASAVSRVHFLDGEPVCISASSDNSIKVWIFDQPEGHAPRLLRSREGHIAPPMRIRYYGTGGFGTTDASMRDAVDGYSCEIVSCGSSGDIRVINTGRESQNREMSQRIILKKLGYDRRRALLPPAIDVDFSEAREKDWGNMVTIHKNHCNAYTWRYRNRTVTEFVLRQPSWKSNDLMYPDDPVNHASALTVSACGNYCVVGSKGGAIHRYNLQSGRTKGSYPASCAASGMKSAVQKKRLATPGNVLNARHSILGAPDETSATGYLSKSLKAKQDQIAGQSKVHLENKEITENGHIGSRITGLFIDAMNEIMVSAGDDSNGLIHFWDFEHHTVLGSVKTGSPVVLMVGYRDGGFVAAVCENGTVKVYDVLTQRLSRVFAKGHTGAITSATFTPDGRRFLTSALDGTIRTWDMLTARCLAWVSIGHPITSMALAPSAEFLSVTLEGKQGIFMYADRSLFETVYFWKEPTAPTAATVSAATVDVVQYSSESRLRTDSNDSSDDDDNDKTVQGEEEHTHEPEQSENILQRGVGAITLSSIPRAYWTTLFNMEAVKARNKPITAPSAPEKAPFFLPTIHREGSVAPSFPTPAELNKAKANASSGGPIVADAGNGKKRKRDEAKLVEENQSDVAAAIAAMGSVWTDDDNFGDDIIPDDANNNEDNWEEYEDDVVMAQETISASTGSRILKSKKIPKEVSVSSRFVEEDIVVNIYLNRH